MIMKNILPILIFTLLTALCSCNRVFHYTNDKPKEATDSIIFDSTTKVFVRKLYLDKNNEKTKDSIAENKDNILIEVQFLIFNQKDEVIYIATTPSKTIYDKGETYLIYKEVYPNTYFLNTFYFGRVFSESETEKKLVFHNRKFVQIWNFDRIGKDNPDKKNQPKLKLTMIDNYRLKKIEMQDNIQYRKPVYLSTENVSLSSKHDFELTKILDFDYISFKIPVKKSDQDQKKDKNQNHSPKEKTAQYQKEDKNKNPPSPKGKGIYFKSTDGKLDYIFIPFDQKLKENYTSVKFNSKRVRYKRDTNDSIPYRNSID